MLSMESHSSEGTEMIKQRPPLLTTMLVACLLCMPLASSLAHAAFSTVAPASLNLLLDAGDVHTDTVSIEIDPFCIRPFEIEVVASDAGALLQNLTGVVINGCGGDKSEFDIEITGTGAPQSFELQFVDAEFGGVLDVIPVSISPEGAGSVHGTKWRDDNGNGQRDADEPGLAGVVIYLDVNGNGRLDPREPATRSMEDNPLTDFDETGVYWLENIVPGNYLVREVAPPDMQQTFPPRGAHAVVVRGGQLQGLDFGNQPLPRGSLHGRKWSDTNGNAEADPDEPGLPGVVIYVDLNNNGQFDPGEPVTRTMSDDPDTDFDESGLYWLVDLRGGEYVIREIVPDGFVQTFPTCDGSHRVRLEGDAITGLDFGNQPEDLPNSIHGVKWLDVDGNGERTSNEPGLPGVVIYSDLNANGTLDPGEPVTRTMQDDPATDFDESGRYWLTGMRPGMHVIREVVPDGFRQTSPGSGAHMVELPAGAVVEGADFGNAERPEGSVHGIKWLDRNANGRRDDDEPGLDGVAIYVDRNGNGQLDRGEPHTRTMADDDATDFDESGRYWLTGLPTGEYVIREVVPEGFMQTFPENGAHGVTVQDDAVEGVDFGNRRARRGAVHGTKWSDENGNGRRERGEPGLHGVIIFSDLNDNGELDGGEPRTRTRRDRRGTNVDEAGSYALKGLAPGRHVIREVVPDGFRQTFPSGPDATIPGGHVVTVTGAVVHDLNFGNRRTGRALIGRQRLR